MPIALLRGTIGLALETRVGLEQPLEFDGTAILNERWLQGTDGAWSGPYRSSTWDQAYQAFKRGEQLALPYYLARATDPDKQSALGEAYQRYRAGLIGAEALPDLANIYPDDPQTRAEIGLETEPGASAAEVLIQACGSCHNNVLDQTLSRARFNIDLSRLDHSERAQAMARLQRPVDSEGVMPPPETRQLDPEARKKLIEYLSGETRSAEDDALLARAAALGMARVMEKKPLLPIPD
jgi:mono/diheme cytochrome c family protein